MLRYILCASVLAGLGGAARAHTIAYATTVEGSLFYPQTSSPGGVGLSSFGTGAYTVTLYGAGNGLNSNVQVNALTFASSPHYCTVGEWYSPNGTDVNVTVYCFNTSGQPVNDDFNVFYQARTAAPPSGSVDFVWGNQPTTSTYTPDSFYSFNSSGGTNSITRENTGLYFVYLPGVHKNGGNAQVTAYGNVAAHCQVVDWYHNLSGINVVVYCVNAAGQAADEYFSMAFTFGTTENGGAAKSVGAYAWANSTALGAYVPSKIYQYDGVSTNRLKAQNISGGVSFLNLPVPQGVLFLSIFGQAVAYGSSGEYCNDEGLGYYGTAKHETLTLTVACFSASGAPLNMPYSAQFITPE